LELTLDNPKRYSNRGTDGAGADEGGQSWTMTKKPVLNTFAFTVSQKRLSDTNLLIKGGSRHGKRPNL